MCTYTSHNTIHLTLVTHTYLKAKLSMHCRASSCSSGDSFCNRAASREERTSRLSMNYGARGGEEGDYNIEGKPTDLETDISHTYIYQIHLDS